MLFRLFKIACLSSIAITACNKSLVIDQQFKESLVIWGAINPQNDTAKIYLTKTVDPYLSDTTKVFVKGAKVNLLENGVIVANFFELDSGYYAISFPWSLSSQYSIKAAAPAFDTLVTVPDKFPNEIKTDSITKQLLEYGFDAQGIVRFYTPDRTRKTMIGTRLIKNGEIVFGGGTSASTLICGNIPIFHAFDYLFTDVSCFDQLPFFEVYSPNYEYQEHTKGIEYGIACFSDQSQTMLEKLAINNNQSTDVPGLNLFYSPVYYPRLVDGGFGGVLFYQSLDTLIRF